MSARLVWRRSATALGMYGSVALGALGTVAATRELGPHDFGLFALVLATTGFFQVLLDLTVEEAMVKYGFRYVERGRFGRLRRLFRTAFLFKLVGALAAGVVIAALSPAGDGLFGADGLLAPLLVAAALPLVQAPENVGGSALILVRRYDVRAGFLALSQALRTTGIVVGARYGVAEAVLGIVVAQAVASAAVGAAGFATFRRYPSAPPEELAEDRPEIVRFAVQASLGTGVVSLRTTLAPLLLGMVSNPLQVGYFRAAQAPQTALVAFSSPARLILLTEQTRDFERGAPETVWSGARRFTAGAAALMAVALPPLLVWTPELVRLVYGSEYSPAADAARLMLAAGALQLVVAWAKSLPVSIGRPGLRIVAHSVETAVLLPLVLVLGAGWDATGAAGAVLASSAVFTVLWLVLLERLARAPADVRGPSPTEPAPL